MGVDVSLRLVGFVIALALRLCFGAVGSCEESISLGWRTKGTFIFQNVLLSNRPANWFCKNNVESHGKNETVYTSIS